MGQGNVGERTISISIDLDTNCAETLCGFLVGKARQSRGGKLRRKTAVDLSKQTAEGRQDMISPLEPFQFCAVPIRYEGGLRL